MPGSCGKPRTLYQCPARPTGAAAASAVVSAAVSNLGVGIGSMGIRSTTASSSAFVGPFVYSNFGQ